ncbi:MAG: helix-turn-helix domain-containing protein [Thiohalocapsa sp. PB-PSB1]|nr:MAG: helix-turn-helix domain-containing protein [Thiohalocapsa sp. PB-PSB1]HCS90700.1 hypothetical protein [Chromatiaceae bacterium]
MPREIIMSPDEIRQLRNSMNLTQRQFAAALGVAFVTLNRWENGQTKPSGMGLEKLQLSAKQAVLGVEARSALVAAGAGCRCAGCRGPGRPGLPWRRERGAGARRRRAALVRASVEPGLCDRDQPDRPAASSEDRRVRAHAAATAAALPARRRRGRRQDHHDRTVRA